MFGEHGRFGVIVPANNATLEPEFWSAVPEGVAIYATRIMAKGNLTPDAVVASEANLDRALDELVVTGVDVIAYADMVTTFVMEPDWNERRSREMTARAGLPVITCWTAMRAALAALGVRRFALATPYPAPVHALCRPYLEREGFVVTADDTLDILAMNDVPQVAGQRLGALIGGLDLSAAEALVILATDLPTFSQIRGIEDRIGLPVLTSNQTLLWHAMRSCGNRATLPSLGRIFDV